MYVCVYVCVISIVLLLKLRATWSKSICMRFMLKLYCNSPIFVNYIRAYPTKEGRKRESS